MCITRFLFVSPGRHYTTNAQRGTKLRLIITDFRVFPMSGIRQYQSSTPAPGTHHSGTRHSSTGHHKSGTYNEFIFFLCMKQCRTLGTPYKCSRRPAPGTTIVDIINGMFGVSYQIIRNHKECEGVLYPFDGYHFSFSFRYWP